MSSVCVVGLGYIGLPVAAILASRGHDVYGCDIDTRIVDSIKNGRAHFFEPDLDMLLQAAVSTGKLGVGSTPMCADFFIIAVPTPIHSDKRPDLSHIEAATRSIAPVLDAGSTVILESTSPVGTTEKISKLMSEMRPDLSFASVKMPGGTKGEVAVAHCPERILPGNTLRELVSNDRVIGGLSADCAIRAASLYRSFVSGELVLTDCRTAEFVKLIENSFRDVNIALANEISMICDGLGIDVWNAISLANRHPRVSILQPGAGVGGHCVAVDPWFVIDGAADETPLIRTSREVNDNKPRWLIDKILSHARRFEKASVACLGITYKADVEDIRESPALEIVKTLASRDDIRVIICDPTAKVPPGLLERFPNISFSSADKALEDADVVALLVGHREFLNLQKSQFDGKIVIDAIGLIAKLA